MPKVEIGILPIGHICQCEENHDKCRLFKKVITFGTIRLNREPDFMQDFSFKIDLNRKWIVIEIGRAHV